LPIRVCAWQAIRWKNGVEGGGTGGWMDAIGCRCVCFSAGLHQEVKDNVMRARDFGMMESERASVNWL
jgi:hypothetical protein